MTPKVKIKLHEIHILVGGFQLKIRYTQEGIVSTKLTDLDPTLWILVSGISNKLQYTKKYTEEKDQSLHTLNQENLYGI